MKDDKQIESVKRYEISKHRKPKDVRGEGRGFDIESSGRLIEVKARSFHGLPSLKIVGAASRETRKRELEKSVWIRLRPS